MSRTADISDHRVQIVIYSERIVVITLPHMTPFAVVRDRRYGHGMAADERRHVVAIGGGMLMPRDAIPFHVEYAIKLSGKATPRLCVLNQAVGDDPAYYLRFYDRLANSTAEVRHLSLFPMPNVEDPEDFLLSQDIIFVGGGSVANMVAVWRVHGDRPDPAQGMAGGHRPGRRVGRRHLLVRGRDDGLLRRQAAPLHRRPGDAGGKLLPALQLRGGAPPPLPAPSRRGRPSRRPGLRRRRWRALRRRHSRRDDLRPPRRQTPTGSTRTARAASPRPSSRSASSARSPDHRDLPGLLAVIAVGPGASIAESCADAKHSGWPGARLGANDRPSCSRSG